MKRPWCSVLRIREQESLKEELGIGTLAAKRHFLVVYSIFRPIFAQIFPDYPEYNADNAYARLPFCNPQKFDTRKIELHEVGSVKTGWAKNTRNIWLELFLAVSHAVSAGLWLIWTLNNLLPSQICVSSISQLDAKHFDVCYIWVQLIRLSIWPRWLVAMLIMSEEKDKHLLRVL